MTNGKAMSTVTKTLMLPCGHKTQTHLLQTGGIQLGFVYNLHSYLEREKTGKQRQKKKGRGREWGVEMKDNQDVKTNSSCVFVFWLYRNEMNYPHYFTIILYSAVRQLCQNMSQLRFFILTP